MSNFKNHLNTVNNHRREVRKLCFKCGLYKQGLMHDLSKYSPTEFLPQIHYWTGKQSPIDLEIKEKGYSAAWLHHKGRNKHHYEYWYDPSHQSFAKIPKKYLAEMFCDRVAASKTYLGVSYKSSSPYEYFQSKRDIESKMMNPDSFAMLEKMFICLKKYGEDRTCKMIKEWLIQQPTTKVAGLQ